MKKHLRPAVAAVALLALLVATPALAARGDAQATQAQATSAQSLEAAAAKAGVSIQTDQMFTVERRGARLSAAVIDGYENVAPRNLASGVDFGFAHFDAPESGIPTGYYPLRATSQGTPSLGENQVRFDLVDADGRTVTSLEGVADVWSLDVPENPPAPQTVVSGMLDTTAAMDLIYIGIWYRCPNGMWICVEIIIFHNFSHF